MARIFMTGGTGFISSRVARRLGDNGHAVHLFHRGETSVELPPDIQHHWGDRTVPGELSAAVDIVQPDILVDMNAYTRDEAARASRAAEQVDVDFVVVISSGDVYRQADGLRGRWRGGPDRVPLTEDSPLRETRYPYRELAESEDDRLYHYDKIDVEEAYLEAAPGATILRLPKVFGADDMSSFTDYLRPLQRRLPVIRLHKDRAGWRWSRGEVWAIADAIVETVESPREGIFNVAPEQCPTELDWVHMLGDVLEWNGHVRAAANGAKSDDDFEWAYDFVLDGSSFRRHWHTRLLTHPMAALEEALADTRRISPAPAVWRSEPARRSDSR
jgi:nucleoside-diphosphate-sugar epimerase